MKYKITSDVIRPATINLNMDQIKINSKHVHRVLVSVRKYVFMAYKLVTKEPTLNLVILPFAYYQPPAAL